MGLKFVWFALQIALMIALTSCGGANQEHYNDRKIYIYSEVPGGSANSADATASTGPANRDPNPETTQPVPSGSGANELEENGDVVVSGSLIGALDAVSTEGRISGWAAWDGDSSKIVSIKVIVDAVELVAALSANVDAFDDDTAGAHGFTFELPETAKDGNDHELEVIASYESESLAFNKITFKITARSEAGRDFFAANLQTTLQNRCGGCHPVNYEQQYASLSTPLPTQGGTVTNNELINMASGRNGNTNHPGGNICGSKSLGVCAQIQQWWTTEFTNN